MDVQASRSEGAAPNDQVDRAAMSRPSAEESVRIENLPDLMDRIRRMGLSEEYVAYRSRYMEWRQGSAHGAAGEVASSNVPARTGFGFWYPSMQVWKWRRTLSYWISVMFFEGSLFFAISSFLACWPMGIRPVRLAVTTLGLAGGNINFFICTYMMCLETINLSNADHHGGQRLGDVELDSSSEDAASTEDSDSNGDEPFMMWPFHGRTALEKLRMLGAGPWPYLASVIYFIGVLVFTVGIVLDLMLFLPKHAQEVAGQISTIASLIGSIMFAVGGFAECVENDVFTTCVWNQGYVGALLNFLGGIAFVIGAIFAFFPGQGFESNLLYGIGAMIYALGSAVQIVMWKDEQFGLTFLAVLNHPGHGQQLGVTPEATKEGTGLNTPSRRTAIFIMVYAALGVLSFYDFCITLANAPGLRFGLALANALNCAWPCFFAHFMLVLNSAFYRTPKVAPFRWLYIACRYIATLMLVNEVVRMGEALHLFGRM